MIWSQRQIKGALRHAGDAPTALAECTTLAELGQHIEAVPGIGWRWVNLYIGMSCVLTPAGAPRESEAWHSQKLWERCLKPWLPWVR